MLKLSMSCNLIINGTLTSASGGSCSTSVSACGGGNPDIKSQGLTFGQCSTKSFDIVQSSDCSYQLNTNNQFVQLQNSQGLSEIQFLCINSDSSYTLRLNNYAPKIIGAGVFPTLFSGGEPFVFEVNGVEITVTFTANAQSAQDVANEINAACALVGISPVATAELGQIILESQQRGPENTIEVTTANGQIGFTQGLATGSAIEILCNGVFMAQVSVSNVYIKCNAMIKSMAAGKA